jgi:uncharacterized membrane protein YdjX (TVP38/TMEM64 family)
VIDDPVGTPEGQAPSARTLRTAKIAVVVVVLSLLVLAQRLGVFAHFKDPEHVRQTLVELGPWGYVVFLVAYTTLQPFGIPGTVFIWAAPLIWPWPTAFALSMTGTMAASVVGFSFSRFVARDWIATKIPQRFRKYDEALARRAFRTVLVLRLIFWMPPLLHAFFGVSKVRFSTHFWASLIAYIVPLFLVSYFGQRMFEVLRRAPMETWVALGAAVIVTVLGGWLLRRRRTAAAPQTTED